MKNWKKIELFFMALLIVIMLVAIYALSTIFKEYHDGRAAYSSLDAYVFLPPEPTTNPVNRQPSDAAPSEVPEETFELGAAPVVDFPSLKAQSSDCVGWIYSPQTAINYPLVKGADNDFYQSHMFNGTANKCGAIFLDCLNAGDLSDQNTLVYGHHMKNGSMFASIVGYAQQDYYEAHPAYWVVTPDQNYQVSIFSAFLTDTESDVWQMSFASTDAFGKWLDTMTRRSFIKSDVVPTVNDRVITLSTCSYETENARFVVMGILQPAS
ncbi:MAG: class B sortase [Lachnospiraceae bacterium]|nr:class B sortase [Lachnospiraceae bacterium]